MFREPRTLMTGVDEDMAVSFEPINVLRFEHLNNIVSYLAKALYDE
jgi:hypothetical protein